MVIPAKYENQLLILKKTKNFFSFKTTLCIVYKDGEYPQDPYVPTIFENYAGKFIKR